MLTKVRLQQLATTSSYSKGEDYFYNGAVRRVKRSGNMFAGKVAGSELYEVSLTLNGHTPTFQCDCLYDYGGICKHCVAFGLAVIDQFGPIVEHTETPPAADVLMESVEQVWERTSLDQKLTFFRQLLEKQPDLIAQFSQFVSAEKPTPQITFFSPTDNSPAAAAIPSIDSISTDVFERLSDLQFDDEGLDMDDYDYYSEESPDPDPLIEDVLADYAGQVTKALREGRLTDAMTIYLGVYEGTKASTDPADDNYDIIDDYPVQSWAVWQNLLADTYTQLAGRVIHPDQLSRALDQLAERVQHFETSAPNTEEIHYDLKDFEPLLLALVTDTASAKVVQRAIQQYNWQHQGTKYVQLQMADKLHDESMWFSIADRFADHDQAIALKLLQRRQQAGDITILLQTLHRLTKPFPNAFDTFILTHLSNVPLSPGPDLRLYLNALENRCRSAGQLSDYLTLRDYWTEEQRRQFANSLLVPYPSHPLLVGQVLKTENRDNDLFVWLKSLSWFNIRQLSELLKLAAASHANECMDLAMERTTTALESGQRGRAMYQSIVSWLAALNTFQTLKPQVAIFAQHLYKTYSRLSALREELRMNQLVRG